MDARKPCNRDIFLFWEHTRDAHPLIFDVAIDFLAIPASTGAVERAFSVTGISSSGRRSSIGGAILESEAILAFNNSLF